MIFDYDLDGSRGIIDIWRVRNPMEKPFTWRQKTPIIQRRLDHWLVNDSLQDSIVSVDIVPSIKSDHSFD